MTSEKPWPADRIERRPVTSLIPYARNARTHSDEQVAQIAASIREWGWTVPVLVDEAGGIIAGHARVLAATLEATGQSFDAVDEHRYQTEGASDNSAACYDAAIAELRARHEAETAEGG